MRKRDLSNEACVRGKAHRRPLQPLLRGKPWPERDRNECEKAFPGESRRSKYRREHEVVDGQQRERMQQRPREARDAAEIAGIQFAPEEVGKQRAIAR